MNRSERRRQQKLAQKNKLSATAPPTQNQQTLSPAQALDLAVQYHTSGRLAEAENIYSQILQADPRHVVALHLLGAVNHHQGKNEIAGDLISQALAISPDYAEAHNTLGMVLQALGRLEEAILSHKKALSLEPNFHEAYLNLGNTYSEMRKYYEAIDSYEKALAILPDYAEAHSNLGNVLVKFDRPKEAIEQFNQALEIYPDHAEVLIGLGNALQDVGQQEEAVAYYSKAIAVNPDYAEAHGSLGTVLQELGRLDEAENCYRTALRLNPDILATLLNLGNLKIDAAYEYERTAGPDVEPLVIDGLWGDVLDSADRVLVLSPGHTEALALKAAALLGLDRNDEWADLMNFDALVQPRILNVPNGYGDLDEFNAALLQRCADDPHKDSDPIRKSMNFGHRIRELQKDGPGSPIDLLLDSIGDIVKLYLDQCASFSHHPFLTQQPNNWGIDAWGTILGQEGYHEAHIHPGGWLSGVYYGKLPKVMATENEKREGWIEFGRTKNHVDRGNDPAFHLVQPAEGKIVLFPSYMYHRTIPFDSDDTRFTVAFDLIPLPD